MFWRQIGGHLKKVEACSAGVTWGIGYDSTAWVYTAGWGGAFLKGTALFSFSRVLCVIVTRDNLIATKARDYKPDSDSILYVARVAKLTGDIAQVWALVIPGSILWWIPIIITCTRINVGIR